MQICIILPSDTWIGSLGTVVKRARVQPTMITDLKVLFTSGPCAVARWRCWAVPTSWRRSWAAAAAGRRPARGRKQGRMARRGAAACCCSQTRSRHRRCTRASARSMLASWPLERCFFCLSFCQNLSLLFLAICQRTDWLGQRWICLQNGGASNLNLANLIVWIC